MNIFGFQKKTREGERGFTLLEVAFVITIFAIMASIVLFRFKDFGTKTAIENLAQDVALRIVSAQKAAISGSLTSGFAGTSEANEPSYGMHFVAGASSDAASREFAYFADTNHNKMYDDPGAACTLGSECLSITSITTGEYVSDICYADSGAGTIPCSSTAGVHITFTRPFPDATINICTSGGGTCSPTPTGRVYIEITSGIDTALKKTIIVTSLGEVRVVDGSACAASGSTICGGSGSGSGSSSSGGGSGIVPPTVTTGGYLFVSSISSGGTPDTAQLYGTLLSDGGDLTAGGIEYSSDTSYSSRLGPSPLARFGTPYAFSVPFSGLSCGTPYNYRAYATNSSGTGYGSNSTFTVPCSP